MCVNHAKAFDETRSPSILERFQSEALLWIITVGPSPQITCQDLNVPYNFLIAKIRDPFSNHDNSIFGKYLAGSRFHQSTLITRGAKATNLPMDIILNWLAVFGGLALLVWSAGKFVDGAAHVAAHFSVPPLLIGIVIIGFGTSAPEMMVSALAASEGKPSLALGNAYGSNIANIALILGMTAIICPIAVQSVIVKKEIPILLAITALSAFLLFDGSLSRFDASVLLGVFAMLMAWSIFQGLGNRDDPLGQEVDGELENNRASSGKAFFWVVTGLILLVASSRLLVWGAVEIAESLGVSDLIIGLTIVAVGTSLPELAASLSAARKGQPDMAVGNVLGSNLFNTLAVVGIAGVISPAIAPAEILYRDLLVVGLLTVALFVVCYGFKGSGIINRFEGALLVTAYVGYTVWLVLGITAI